MRFWRSWQLGAPGTPLYKLYDILRNRLNRKLVRHLTHQIAGIPGARVIEAGSGPAFASSLLAREPGIGLSIALDFDLQVLQLSRKRDPGLAFVLADLYDMPFAADTFDLVWNSSTLEHLSNPASGLEEMARLLKQGGKVFVGVPYAHGPLGFQRWIKDTKIGTWIGTVFTKDQLQILLLQCGFSKPALINYFLSFFVGATASK